MTTQIRIAAGGRPYSTAISRLQTGSWVSRVDAMDLTERPNRVDILLVNGGDRSRTVMGQTTGHEILETPPLLAGRQSKAPKEVALIRYAIEDKDLTPLNRRASETGTQLDCPKLPRPTGRPFPGKSPSQGRRVSIEP